MYIWGLSQQMFKGGGHSYLSNEIFNPLIATHIYLCLGCASVNVMCIFICTWIVVVVYWVFTSPTCCKETATVTFYVDSICGTLYSCSG